MLSVEFECQLITPLFMAGAYQSCAELRAPSIKGLLRWWFRASNSNLSLGELAKVETEVFGNTEGASTVGVQVRFSNLDIGNFRKKDIKAEENLEFKFDEQGKRMAGEDAGIAYLFYSTFPRRDNETGERKYKGYLKPGFHFQVSLESSKREALKRAAKAFWLLSFLGGLGSRSRRGAGNFSVLRVDGIEQLEGVPSFCFKGTKAEELLEFLNKGVGVIPQMSSTLPNFTFLDTAEVVLINKPFSSWKESLDVTGAKYEEYRRSIRNPSLASGASFGMPVMHRKKLRIVPQADGQTFDRFASPFIFKVWNSNDKYFAGVIRLGSSLYGGTVDLVSERKDGRDWKYSGKFKVDQNAVNKFLNQQFPTEDTIRFSLGRK